MNEETNMRRIPALLLIFLLFAACGDPALTSMPDTPGVPPAGNTTSGPDTPVSGGGGGGDVPGGGGPERVRPKPGTVNPVPLGWHRAKPVGQRTLDVIFWSGVEPCYVLDRVEVEESEDEVAIALFQGSAPSDEDVACIDIAVKKVVRIKLARPLGDRTLTDPTD